MDFHIGAFIKKIAEEKKVGPTELGRLISTSKQNVYGIFKRQSIDTGLLWKLSKALEYNFFSEYVRHYRGVPDSWRNSSLDLKDEDHLARELDRLKASNVQLQEENNRLLKEMVELLRGSGSKHA